MRPHQLPGGLGGGGHQRGHGADAERHEHEGTVGAGHLAQRLVRQVAKARASRRYGGAGCRSAAAAMDPVAAGVPPPTWRACSSPGELAEEDED